MSTRYLKHAIILACILAAPSAQAGAPGLSVGAFTAEESCTTYELEWGREFAAASGASASQAGGVVNGAGAAFGYQAQSQSMALYAKEWGAELRTACVANFPGVRSTVAAALASSGGVPTGGRALTLTGRVTDIGYDTQSVVTAGSDAENQFMVVGVEYHLRDASGRIVFGGALTKRLNISMRSDTSDVSFERSLSGRTQFAQAQQQLGYAVARAVIFHLNPLRVTENDGKAIALNYGAPLVPLGSAVIASSDGSLRGRRLTVTSSTTTHAYAESDARVGLSDVPIGSIVRFVEADDAAAISRIIDRVELPEN